MSACNTVFCGRRMHHNGGPRGKKPHRRTGRHEGRLRPAGLDAIDRPSARALPPSGSLTVAGKERYDAAVHRFLVEHSDWQASGLLRAHVDGTKVQIRGALERLLEAGLVERVGQFGATKWRARAPA